MASANFGPGPNDFSQFKIGWNWVPRWKTARFSELSSELKACLDKNQYFRLFDFLISVLDVFVLIWALGPPK